MAAFSWLGWCSAFIKSIINPCSISQRTLSSISFACDIWPTHVFLPFCLPFNYNFAFLCSLYKPSIACKRDGKIRRMETSEDINLLLITIINVELKIYLVWGPSTSSLHQLQLVFLLLQRTSWKSQFLSSYIYKLDYWNLFVELEVELYRGAGTYRISTDEINDEKEKSHY